MDNQHNISLILGNEKISNEWLNKQAKNCMDKYRKKYRLSELCINEQSAGLSSKASVGGTICTINKEDTLAIFKEVLAVAFERCWEHISHCYFSKDQVNACTVQMPHVVKIIEKDTVIECHIQYAIDLLTDKEKAA